MKTKSIHGNAVHARIGEWNRFCTLPPRIMFVEFTGEREVIVTMIKKYIDKDGDLVGWDMYHFLNWCANFDLLDDETKSKFKDVSVHFLNL